MKEFTYQDFDTVYYRKKKLRDAAQELMDLTSGSRLDIRPYMRDEDGRYSEERTLATVEELLDALKTYLRFERAEPADEKRGDVRPSRCFYVEDGGERYVCYEMPEEETACYRGFLYCALRDIYANYRDTMRHEYRQTFGDLIALAADDRVFPSFSDLLRQRYLECVAPMPQISFAPAYDESTDKLAGTLDRLLRLRDPSRPLEFQSFYLASDEEMERLVQSLTEEQRKLVEARVRECEEWEAYERQMEESGELFAWEAVSEEDAAWSREEEQERRRYEERYARDFGNLDSYRAHLEQYLRLQHLRGSGAAFLDAVTGMVDFFLLAKGSSCFADQETFYKILARLQFLTRQIDAMLCKKEV